MQSVYHCLSHIIPVFVAQYADAQRTMDAMRARHDAKTANSAKRRPEAKPTRGKAIRAHVADEKGAPALCAHDPPKVVDIGEKPNTFYRSRILQKTIYGAVERGCFVRKDRSVVSAVKKTSIFYPDRVFPGCGRDNPKREVDVFEYIMNSGLYKKYPERFLGCLGWRMHERRTEDGRIQNRLDVVMEQMDCEFFELIRNTQTPSYKGRKLSRNDAYDILLRVSNATAMHHLLGIALLDISPENILVSNVFDEQERRVVLCDYGLATKVSTSNPQPVMRIDGKPRYFSTERHSGEPFDAFKDDVFAVAVIGFMVSTGLTWFDSSQDLPKINPESELYDDVDRAVQRLVLDTIHTPESRRVCASVFHEKLEKILCRVPIA